MKVSWLVGWLRINVDLAIFQPYLDLEAGDNQYLQIQVARPAIESQSSCSASQELNHSATVAPHESKSRWALYITTSLKDQAIRVFLKLNLSENVFDLTKSILSKD